MSSNQESVSSKETNQSVTLKSSDDCFFTLTITEAAMSEKIKDLIKDCPSSPSSSSGAVIPLDNIDGEVLERVTTFMKKHAVENLSVFDKMKFNEEFLSGMDVYEHLDLAMGAYGLKVNYLVEATCQKIADHIKNKSVEYVRKLFNIENDFTPEEEEKIRRENAWAFEDVDDDDE